MKSSRSIIIALLATAETVISQTTNNQDSRTSQTLDDQDTVILYLVSFLAFPCSFYIGVKLGQCCTYLWNRGYNPDALFEAKQNDSKNSVLELKSQALPPQESKSSAPDVKEQIQHQNNTAPLSSLPSGNNSLFTKPEQAPSSLRINENESIESARLACQETVVKIHL